MYRIMLIDDEVGVRNSIKAKIDWASAGFEIALEAANGLEALQLLEDTRCRMLSLPMCECRKWTELLLLTHVRKSTPRFVSLCFRATRISNI